jgi:pimeloyl-ACP methyl ester carboxylesterase
MLLETISRADQRAYRAAMRSLASFDSRRWLNELTLPALVVTGSEDTTVSPARQTILAQGIPGARQAVVEGAGHAVSVDRADEFNRLLLEFLQEN